MLGLWIESVSREVAYWSLLECRGSSTPSRLAVSFTEALRIYVKSKGIRTRMNSKMRRESAGGFGIDKPERLVKTVESGNKTIGRVALDHYLSVNNLILSDGGSARKDQT
jgi:hypothetical protein